MKIQDRMPIALTYVIILRNLIKEAHTLHNMVEIGYSGRDVDQTYDDLVILGHKVDEIHTIIHKVLDNAPERMRDRKRNEMD